MPSKGTQNPERVQDRKRSREHGGGLIRLAGMVLIAWALLQELRKPAAEPTWTGTVAGVVPYDFRRPTLARVQQRLWAPTTPGSSSRGRSASAGR